MPALPERSRSRGCFTYLLLAIGGLPAIAAVPTPQRELTDPHSFNSPANSNAAPVPIADLFYTRSNGGIGWSPDGKHVVISTNFSGRGYVDARKIAIVGASYGGYSLISTIVSGASRGRA
jgi:hypothetical protein